MRLWLAMPVLMALALPPLAAGPARADDTTDCEAMLPSRRIPACTRIIEGKGTTPLARAHAFANRGRGYMMRTGEERLADADFRSARKLVPPASPEAALYEGLSAIATNQLPLAISRLDEAATRDPKSALVLFARGAVHLRQGNPDAAFRDYDLAILLAPSQASGYGGRGIALAQMRDYQGAIADFDAAMKLDSSYAATLRRRGLAKTELGRLDEAIADYDAALRIDPQLAVAYNGRGYAYSKKGDLERALFDFEAALRIDPTLMVAHANRGLMLMRRGDGNGAIAEFERVLALPPLTAEDRRRQQLARERMQKLKSAAKGPAANPAGRRVALVIGNSRYVHAGPLTNPVNDAKAVSASLKRLGFAPVLELVDGTREQMGSALKQFGDNSEGAEWALVYFAGHGMEINGLTYLIPVDAALRRDTHVDDEAVSLSRVMTKVDAARRIGLVILDACRNNPFAARMVRSAGATRALTRGLAPVEPEGNVLVAYAAKHGTVAEDGTGRNSPFAAALLANLEESGLEINFLFRRVRDLVRRQTERRQEPFVYGSLGNDPLYLRAASTP